MLILLSSLFILGNINAFNKIKSYQFNSFFPRELIEENLNDLLNDGINRTTFFKFFRQNQFLYFVYDTFIYLMTNSNFSIHHKFSQKISPYLNSEQSLYSISTEIHDWFINNKNEFVELKNIISEFGPHLCASFNLDYDVLYRLYDYIFVNDENDRVILGNVLDILNLPHDFILELSKIFSFFDNNQPIIELFNGLNSQEEYLNFIEKVSLLKIPKNDDTKFFSFIRIIDAFSSFVDLISSIHQNFLIKNQNEVIYPILKSYLINPIDIFNVSIFDRANELEKVLKIFDNYSYSCVVLNSSFDDTIKCKVYETVESLLNRFICDKQIDDISCDDNAFEKARLIVSDFTNPQVNLSQLLIVKYKFPENLVRFVFGLMDNLTSENKTYLDLLQGMTLIIPENINISIFHYHNVQFQTFVKNVTNFVNFILNINESSNFKLAFDYLNRTEQWNKLHYLVDEISHNKTLCDFKNVTEKICGEMINFIIGTSKILVSKESISDVIPKQYLNIVVNGLIPLFKSIESDISVFVSNYYNLTRINSENVSYVNFTLLIQKNGHLFDKIVTLLDKMVPEFYKQLPFIGHRYQRFVIKSHIVFDVLKRNGKTISIFNSIFGKFGVIAKMLSSGARAYRNENTTMETITKAVQPTYFLNTYKTLLKLSQLKDLTLSDLANSITYDYSSRFNFNYAFPIKTISTYADLIDEEMNENILKFETVAKSVGLKAKELKYRLISFINRIISSPYKSIREVAIKTGNDPKTVDNYLMKMRNFSTSVKQGKIISFSNKDIHESKENKKRLSTPVIIGITIAVFVVVSIIVALTLYFVMKKDKKLDNEVLCQQIMSADN